MDARERVHRRLAAIWSADAAGYSRRMAEDEAGTLGELRSRRAALRALVETRGGRVVDEVGDNLLAEFPSAVDAVECAMGAQESLDARDAALPESRRLPFRIGIHLGDVVVDGDALAGDGVNVAAHICALAEPGGICISAAIAEHLRGKLDCELEDRGERRLKSMPSPVRVYRVRGSGAAGRSADPPGRRESRPAIAVLPFENLGGDPEQEYLGDGIAEELLTRMARWELPVIARQSSFSYRGRRLDARDIGRELGARYLVEGSIRRAADQIRLTVQLIDAATGEHVFAERFDRALGDVFALQDEIARAIAGSLGASLVRREQSRALARDPESVDAWDALLRARWHHNRYTPHDWRQARLFARRAFERDPRLARAHALFALVEYSGLANGWTDDPERSLSEALGAAHRAIELDACDAGAHLALGLARFRAGELEAARLAFLRAIELEPDNASTHGHLGWLLTVIGRYDEAVLALERAIELEEGSPTSPRPAGHPFWHFHLASAHLGAHRDAEALRCAERALQLGDHALVHGLSAAILGHLGRKADASRHLAHVPGLRAPFVEQFMAGANRALVERLLEGLRLAGMPE